MKRELLDWLLNWEYWIIREKTGWPAREAQNEIREMMEKLNT